MKRFIEGQERSQLILLPDCLDDYVGEDNPVRVVDAFIDELDLAALGFDGVVPETTGRPAYHPATLLKIYLYGYLNRVQSSTAARTGSAAQYRADVADRAAGTRLQDDRRLPQGQWRGDPGGVCPVCGVVPRAGSVHPRRCCDRRQ